MGLRKLRRTADAVTPHMEQAQREADYLEGVVARAPSASADELRAVADELAAAEAKWIAAGEALEAFTA